MGGVPLRVEKEDMETGSPSSTIQLYVKLWSPVPFSQCIRQGAPVRQGQLIDFVGSSGLATGPHLDFGII
jgi:hypothetical protein